MRRLLYSLAGSIGLLIPLAAGALGIQVIIDGQSVVFTDVSQSAWFATYVRSAAEAGIVNGYKDSSGRLTGKFGPGNNVTVAEALKIAVESAGYDEEAYGALIDSGVNHWASAYLSVAASEHFSIYSRSMNWNRAATRAEVASMFTSAFRVQIGESVTGTYFTDVKMSTTYGTAIETLAKGSVISGDTREDGTFTGTYRPTDRVNRAEVVKIAMNARATYGEPGKGRRPSEQPAEENVIRYGAGGFSPSVLRVKSGVSVTFKNDTNSPMWVASHPHPSHTDYPGFDAGKSYGPGESFIFTFNRIGTWNYHNHYKASDVGTIIVE